MALKVNELFSGIGAFRKALINLKIPHEIVGISEIDKYAIASYEAIYGQTRNYGDISKVERLDYADLWTYGFPCQDISLAGRMDGIVKGQTRSGLLYEVQRLLAVAETEGNLPKYLIMENVKNLTSSKFMTDFQGWLDWLESIGYENYWKVLNSKDFGIPQHRERVFVVSIRKDLKQSFVFPEPNQLTTPMKDFLEDEVDEKYYLSDAYLKYATELTVEQTEIGNGFKFTPIERECRNKQNNHSESGQSDEQLHNRNTPPRYLALDEQNGYIRKDGCIGTIVCDGSSPKHNNRIIEILPAKSDG